MKKKIAIVITKSEIGGAQTWVKELYSTLKSHFDIYLITSESGWLTTKFPEDKTYIIPGISSIKKPLTIIKIATILKDNSIDVVISNSANAGLYSRLAKIFSSHKHIYVSHGWSCIYNGGRSQRFFCWVEKILSHFSNTVLCVSERDKKNALEIIGIREEKITVIKNKITPLPKKEKINTRLKALFVGRMTHPKRADLFIEAAKKLPGIDFYLIGDGPLIKNLKLLSQDYDRNIFFLGEINNFKSYCDFDIFVLCSDSEGLPMSAIEAGSSGLPLILSDVGGCSELIYSLNNQTNGLLVENNIDSIISALTQLSEHYSNYYDAAKNLRYEFDIKTVADDYIKLIQG
ncbi:TPA: glycosyltransferase [Morganella morganii]|nr:glycosyltransferase [Morganella morganii]